MKLWRLIQFIIFFAIFVLFIIFNLENKCNISFGFKTFPDAPVYLTAFLSFIAGMLCAVPFTLGLKSRKKGSTPPKDRKPGKSGGNYGAQNGPYGID